MNGIRSGLVNRQSRKAQATAVVTLLAFALMGASAIRVDGAAAAYKLPAGSVTLQGALQITVGKVRCGKIHGSWLPGTKLGGPYFISHTQQAANYKKLASHEKGKARAKDLKTAAGFKSKASSELKSCTLRFSIAGAAGLALKSNAGANPKAGPSTHTRDTGAHASATGSNLQTITSNGAVADAVASGTASISRFLIAPNGKVYVVFAQPVDLATGQPIHGPGATCLLAEVPKESGIPTCIDSTLRQINWNESPRGENPPIQFDAAGAIYYSGYSSDGKTVLRKYLAGRASDLISDQVRLAQFVVLPNGGAVVAGSTTATNQSWTRRITQEGGIQSLLTTSPNFLKTFPDGNIYMGVWADHQFGVRRFLPASSQMDTRYWITGNLSGFGPAAFFNADDYCAGTNLQTRYAFCGSYGTYLNGFITTTDGKAFGLNGCCGQAGLLTQYYPTLTFPQTTVKNVTVAQGATTNLILAGTDAASQNIMTLYNTSNGVETKLLGAANDIEIYHVNYVAGGNKVLFDGLRFSDNKYVLGQVDLSTKQVSVTSTIASKWSDFQTFG